MEKRRVFLVVSMNSDDRIVIGAPFNDGNGSNAGRPVYEYPTTLDPTRSDIDGEAAGDQFGYSSATCW